MTAPTAAVAAACSPIEFEHRASGRVIAKLGIHQIGQISPWGAGACWVCFLPGPLGVDYRPRRAPSVEEGILQFERFVRDWIEASGGAVAAPAGRRP